MEFAYPAYLWLLLLVPVVPALYALSMKLRARRLRKLGDEQLVRALMPSYAPGRAWLRTLLFAAALGFIAVGLARPRVGASFKEKKLKGAEIIICLDVSNSMLADDYSPNRLERAKLAISRLVDKLSEDRIGLVIFAGSSFVQLPVTADYVSAKMFLSSLNPDAVTSQGTDIGNAIYTAARSFSAEDAKSRAIIIITDGENHEEGALEQAKVVAESGVRLFTIGVGSVKGQPISINGELMRDAEGEIVVTKLDESLLQQIAAVGNGAYVHAGNEEFGLNPIVSAIDELEDDSYTKTMYEEYDEYFMYFFAAALLLLAVEALIGWRRRPGRFF